VVHLRQQSTRMLILEGDYQGARWAAASSQSERQNGRTQTAKAEAGETVERVATVAAPSWKQKR
jgi:hypothetical protein